MCHIAQNDRDDLDGFSKKKKLVLIIDPLPPLISQLNLIKLNNIYKINQIFTYGHT